jgi:transcriptional regulator with XRE-family HTH domain
MDAKGSRPALPHGSFLLSDLGANIDVARKRRRLKISQICERAGVSQQTYQRLKKGEPGVSLGALLSVLTALDLEGSISQVADPSTDEYGISLERARTTQRIKDEGSKDVGHNMDPDW